MRSLSQPRAILVLLALQVAVFAAIEPRGEFPLNDDWAYAHSVQWLLVEHRIRLSDWVAMNLLPQTLAGGATAAAFGFSFGALRHLTQGIALIASVGAFRLFLAAGLTNAAALGASFAVVATPWWMTLANSYMTDIYAMVFALPAAALYLRALAKGERASPAMLAAATALSMLGVLQRQVVLVLPLAFAGAWIASRAAERAASLRSPRNWACAFAPFLACVLAVASYKAYLIGGPGISTAQEQIEGRLLPMLGSLLAGDPFYWLWSAKLISWLVSFIGLTCAGYALWLFGRGGGTARQRTLVLIGATALVAAMLAGLWIPPFRGEQMITAVGLGPYSLVDVLGLREHELPAPRPVAFWLVVGIPAAFGAGAFLAATGAAFATCWRERGRDARRVFVLLVVIGYLLPFAITDFVDRYLLFVLPFVLLLLHDVFGAPRFRPRPALAVAGALVITGMAGLSAAAAHDYFAWNRARWDAIAEATRRGATPDTLDGGFEYQGWYRFEIQPRAAVPGKSWWWVKDDRYCVSFDPRPGYLVLRAWPVSRWLPSTPPQVLLLERAGD